MTRHSQQYMIPLFLYGDLSESDRQEFERHLAVCEECRRELENTKKLHSFLALAPAPVVEESMLQQARMQAQAAIRAERTSESLLDRIKGLFAFPLLPRPAASLAAVALVLVGFFAGRLLPRNVSADSVGVSPTESGEGVRVTNVQLAGGGSGEDVDLVFDAVTPVRLHGSLSDPAIQKVLAYAMVNSENAGVRLRAVGSVASTSVLPPEREVKAALLLALKADQNDGVRKEALSALLRYPADREVRDALLEVLLNDANPGLRVAAINGLDSLRVRGYRPDDGLLKTFRQRLQNDENQYVRVKAQSLSKGTFQ